MLAIRPCHNRHLRRFTRLCAFSLSQVARFPLASCVQRYLSSVSQRAAVATAAAGTPTMPRLPLLDAIEKHDANSVCVIHSDSGRSFSYGDLLKDVVKGRDRLLETADGRVLKGERVAFLIENGYDYVVTFLSVLAVQGVALPLSASFPTHELQYILNNSEPTIFVTSAKHYEKAQDILKDGIEKQPIFAQYDKIMSGGVDNEKPDLYNVEEDVGGLMLYTSGTTSRPKGVIIPTEAISAQAQSLIKAWDYSTSDRLLHCLPLHHIHGLVNAVITPLFAGSAIEFMFPFNATAVWKRFAAPFTKSDGSGNKKEKITFFTVVPTIYSRLLNEHKDLPEDIQEAARIGISPENLRLNISGSAALPTPTKSAWTELSHGNVLLERYGMTEVGMALSCGLANEDRVDGSVGWPLPSVEARLVDTDSNEIIEPGQELDKDGKERHGEIQLRGPTIFKEYFRNAEATESEFVKGEDGKGRWFKTGDVAVRREVPDAGKSGQNWAKGPMYFIQGRKSADIIKTGGEKVSALEVEREMLSLPEVAECAVVPIESEKWGQKVASVVVLSEQGKTAGKDGKQWSPLDMRRAMKERLVPYKIPQDMKVVDELPKNAMGKVNKKSLVKEIFGEGNS